MKNITRFDIDPYDATLYFTTSRKAFKKMHAKFADYKVTLKDCCGMSSNFKGNNVQLIGVFNCEPGTLSHELSHMTFNVLEACGIPTNTSTSEAFCYMMSHMTSLCWPVIVKNEKARKKRA